MLTFAEQCLLDELIQRLHILLVNDFRQHSKSISLNHVVLGLLDVFA